MKIKKGSRHGKIIGDLGERIVCNWLSRFGFEVAVLDHTGLDIVAYHPKTKKRYGISVKSRTRVPGREDEAVNLFSCQKGDRRKLLRACKAFSCDPWVAVYVEAEAKDHADLYLTSLDNHDSKYRTPGRAIDAWKMGAKAREKYRRDPSVNHIHLRFEFSNWEWRTRSGPAAE